MHVSNLPIAEALSSLNTSAAGLDTAEAERRLGEFGHNRIEKIKGDPLWLRFVREFTHFFAIILWVAAGLALFAETQSPGQGMRQLGAAILAVILINGVFSFGQEYRAERAIAALCRLLPPQVKVQRDGVLQTMAADWLVPGDVVDLQEGDRVPADCRVIEASGLRVNLSTLTGEPLAKARRAEGLSEGPALEAVNLLLAGTNVVTGQTRAVVFATGMRTEFGRIADLTQTAGQTGSPLQREIARLSRLLALFAAGLGLAFFGMGMVVGLTFWENAIFAIGIVVALVPEGLLPTVTLSLAMATQRMAKRNALVRHLPAVETLGATTVICTDKTGTLTQNRMAVRRVFQGGAEGRFYTQDQRQSLAAASHLLRNARHCHSLKRAVQGGREVWLGDPMEVAFAEFAGQIGYRGEVTYTGQIPFDAERRRMSVVVADAGARWIYCKGAPEAVLPLCTAVSQGVHSRALQPADRRRVIQAQEEMAASGMRVLAFAHRRLGASEPAAERGLVLAGLIGLEDPPRPEVPEAIARCRSAGIKVVMVTGDHPHTALAVAREIGLVRGDNAVVVRGQDLRRMTPAQLQLTLRSQEILFTRVTAEQKMLVVQALKRKGEVVAVTGDGVNDAPALKAADIGISMGITGTDVAKEAADMILLDDNFASIVNAIEEGRAVYANIRKFLTYILTSNIPELIPYLAFVLLKIPLPLTILQILAIDLGTDLLPALALGAERSSPLLMKQPPRSVREPLLTWGVFARAYLWLGMLQAAVSMAMYFTVLHGGGWRYAQDLAADTPLYRQATTACLAAIVMAQVVNLFVCRHPQLPAWKVPIRGNSMLIYGIAAEVALILAIVYTPLGQAVFATGPLPAVLWGLMVTLALAMGALEELRKLLMQRRRRRRPPPLRAAATTANPGRA